MSQANRPSPQTTQMQRGTKNMSNQIWKVAEAIGVEQARTLDEVLGLFDAEQPRRFIALFGNLEGASALLSELAGSRSLRTPSHRRLVGVVVDATELPLHIDAWQHLLLQVLGKLAESVNTPQNIVVGEEAQAVAISTQSGGISAPA